VGHQSNARRLEFRQTDRLGPGMYAFKRRATAQGFQPHAALRAAAAGHRSPVLHRLRRLSLYLPLAVIAMASVGLIGWALSAVW
jgi:hypothetical protein